MHSISPYFIFELNSILAPLMLSMTSFELLSNTKKVQFAFFYFILHRFFDNQVCKSVGSSEMNLKIVRSSLLIAFCALNLFRFPFSFLRGVFFALRACLPPFLTDTQSHRRFASFATGPCCY